MTTTVAFDRGDVQSSAKLLREERLRIAPDEPGLVPGGRGWAPAAEQMAELCADCPDTIGDVLRMLTRAQQIMNELPPPAANRVAAFNSLYFTITDRVETALRGSTVRDADFLELLDVEFAKRYFEALRLWGEEDLTTPDAWEILFRRAQDHRLSKLAAAMLGVNAHINHDLALALTATWERLGPPRDELVHPDYLLVNDIFYAEIPGLRRRYSTRWQLRIDGLVGDLDDWSQRVLVAATRARAWEQAERLWALRDDEEDLARAMLVMDRASAYVGELLITGDGVVNRVGAALRVGRDSVRTGVGRLLGRRGAAVR
ncbi:DUF5995 family protein [Couchioplanes caeruleus]|uniref:Uncharacterized protein n=2 Tax=Couchioplanes caeruleus TaxID=56438 RepID=A0A1K0FT66_9ACTN|nr:DUF5995 family protein [Couchioplanes caeruleus]OJF16005.1 hypothetical protein BG844_01890 [Couchioplanes caeruleus subsp. caeruleus]ROP27863.1 hypothetical protein EDD30_0558 [Couchioplanes caeruleus]